MCFRWFGDLQRWLLVDLIGIPAALAMVQHQALTQPLLTALWSLLCRSAALRAAPAMPAAARSVATVSSSGWGAPWGGCWSSW